MFTNQYFLQVEANYRYERLQEIVKVDFGKKESKLANVVSSLKEQPCCHTICCAQ